MTSVTKKHPQFILAIAAAFFNESGMTLDGYNTMNPDEFFEKVQSHVILGEREKLEKDPSFRQILPYVVLEQEGDDGVVRYIPYRRTKAVGESRLAGNVSIGYGGHIDLFDVMFTPESVLLLKETIIGSLMRELVEELAISDHIGAFNKGVALAKLRELGFLSFAQEFITVQGDVDNGVHQVHLALLVRMRVPKHWKVTCGEDELKTMQPMSGREIIESDLPVELWSKIVIDTDRLMAANA